MIKISQIKNASTSSLDFLSRNRQGLLILLSFSILLACLYHVSLAWLFNVWMTDKAYSHGFFIPIISLYLIWLKRDFLPNIAIKPARISGALAVIFSLALLAIGRAGVIVQLEAISFLLILPSIILFTLGWQYLKALALPLFYLQFMVPWLDPVINRIYMPFQLISAELGTLFLRLAGYSVYHDNIYIYLPNISLEVARACSGIQFLFSVMAIGLALVYLTQKTWWRAAFVLLMGVVIVILSNGIRVALAGVMGQNFGAELLHGPGHIFRGWFVAQVGYVGIFMVNWLVTKRKSPLSTRLFERSILTKKTDSRQNNHKNYLRPALCLLAFLVFFSAYLHLYATSAPTEPPPLQKLSYRLGSWYGQDGSWFEPAPYFPNVDAVLMRTYTNPRAEPVKVFIAYYSKQSVGKRLVSFHSRPLYDKGKVITLDNLTKPKRVRHAVLTIENKKYETFAWFNLPSGNYTTRSETKINTILDGLLRHENNGAFILLAVPKENGQTAAVSAKLGDFISAFAPAIGEIIAFKSLPK